MRVLVVLPSYNERKNIIQLIESILELQRNAHICVVDDSSPDMTYQVVREEMKKNHTWAGRVHLIVRDKKNGRGGAVRDGFSWGIENEGAFEAFVEMDCDFSHEPEAIDTGLALLNKGADIVIGARYPEGEIIGWPLSRRVFSALANYLARFLIDWSIADYTNGFRFYSRRAIDELLKHEQQHLGYIYLSETISEMLKAGMTISAFPIRFKNRRRGVSNTNLKEVTSAFMAIFKIAWHHRTTKR
ncbi:MAG: glycosyltransferase [Myxococcota bacterium]|nr:glycosyltransferase [Myxococcota bacterium]